MKQIKHFDTPQELCRFLFPRLHKEEKCACYTLAFIHYLKNRLEQSDTVTRNLR